MNERLSIKESLIGIGICLFLFVRGYIWLITGQGYVNPEWMSVLVCAQTVGSLYVGGMLGFNIDHERRKDKEK